jgi:hypothetical protein
LIAGFRALGILARLQLGKVKNHIGVVRLTEKFGTNELIPHGMVNVNLNNRWLKVSPAFNKSLCRMYNVFPWILTVKTVLFCNSLMMKETFLWNTSTTTDILKMSIRIYIK